MNRQLNVQLICDGLTWSGWQSFSITKSLSQVQHSFQMTTTDRYQSGLKNWNVKGGSLIEIYIDGNKVFEGYVQKYNPSVTADSHQISISGESKAIDLVQCSHVGKYFWKNVSPENIIKEIVEPFGLEVIIDGELEKIPKEGLRVAVDNNAFDILKKLAGDNGLLIFTDDEGKIRIAKDMPQNEYCMLTTGDYTQISAEHDMSTIFSKLILKSQEKTYKANEFEKRQRKENIANNEKLTRYRPKTVITDGKKQTQDKLEKYINRRLNGDGKKASVTVKSPYDKNGNLWGVGQRVWIKEPVIDVDQELLIAEMTMSLSEQGYETQLSLQVPQTFSITPATPVTVRRSKGFFEGIMDIFS